MERYNRAHFVEAGQVDPMAEWAAFGGETVLEEPMWQLGLGGGSELYAERPDEADCIHYLRTGFCGYGPRCRFNHPHDRGAATGSLRSGGGEYPERIGQPVCQHYMQTGICKFGASCKYDHPKHRIESSAAVTLNFYGYPLREGGKECAYYIKTGQCKFGITCKFHHPQPAGLQVPAQLPGSGPLAGPPGLPGTTMFPTARSPIQSSQQYGIVPGNWPVARPAILPGSYGPGNYGPLIFPPGVVPVPGWSPYPVTAASPVAPSSTQPTICASPMIGIMPLSTSASAFSGSYVPISSSTGHSSSSQKENAFPDRPGQLECQYYLKTGDCKYGSTCKYHHPPDWSALRSGSLLSPMGLPLRSGSPVCSHYAQNGVCKYGPSCKFDHPMSTLSYSTSASSLTDMHVAPYPVGHMNASLAPSSSSSDFRPDLISVITKDAFSMPMSSLNSTSASSGSSFSKSEPVPESNVHQSGQGSSFSSDHSSPDQGG
ncbi:zinc finger CCCH domain-containing protein 32-like isoform X1 [Primulina eburnea]|uniref:zinc finger CCCH domain-containing protein 32-like isoform X1 n=1 Tax=Primulina eburnea TaxID=1245227 RepID=UPI003C6C90D7